MSTQNELAIARINNEIDGWYMNRHFYLTAWCGEPDTENVSMCDSKIAELNEALKEYMK